MKRGNNMKRPVADKSNGLERDTDEGGIAQMSPHPTVSTVQKESAAT